jgi:predicted RNA-binding protein YlxR (DUF448 family)
VTRGGRPKDREAPERRCIVTRESAPKAGLVRFVVAPDGAVVPDVVGKLPGRGLYVTADAKALAAAVAKGHFAKAARRPATPPADLAGLVEAGLAQRLVELIAMARKAGQAIAGLEKVKEALVTRKVALLVQASDGSERGKAALRPPEGENTYVGCLTADELGLAFARDSVIHAAVLEGGLAKRIGDEARRLAGVRGSIYDAPSADGAMNDSADERTAGEGLRAERQTTE